MVTTMEKFEDCREKSVSKEERRIYLLNVNVTRVHEPENVLQENRKEKEKEKSQRKEVGKEKVETQRKELGKEKVEVLSYTGRFNKQKMGQEASEDTILLLENEKQLMQKEIAAQENARNMLEDEITRMKAENKRLTMSAAAVQELSDSLNDKIMSLNV
ncbi:MAP7 domain-containing protein 2-like [Macrobrachium rosenbergii]|uniref:MAP7 domain-containing protein 2-like n=1 Tax=Macrobrachium rosenbergii TaxID=79674 RepID=UPI0034D3BA46